MKPGEKVFLRDVNIYQFRNGIRCGLFNTNKFPRRIRIIGSGDCGLIESHRRVYIDKEQISVAEQKKIAV